MSKKFRPYQCAIFKKEMLLLFPYEEMFSHIKLLTETFSYFARSLHPNIKFLICKENKRPKINPKMLKQ